MPSPTLELAYAYYRVQRGDQSRSFAELPWLQALQLEHPAVVEAVQGLWNDGETEAGFDLFWFVCEMGFAMRDSVEPLFAEFVPALDEFIVRVQQQREKMGHEKDDTDHARQKYAGLRKRLESLRNLHTQQRFLDALRQLWSALEPLWVSEGLPESTRATQAFLLKFEEHGNVLEALPAHHFVQFEGSAQEIRSSLEKGRLMVVPLFFAAGGGFNLDFLETHVLGYGIHSEMEFQRLQAQTSSVAARMKALGDPTRLLLLTLVARYTNFVVTVGDLASQLGVSQPTASAHLKLLKDNGLVTLERKGNKSFYRVDADALEAALDELRSLMRLK
jgi:ArsR family transcriptional regulator, arsenate/arsenite/antimonite-responsive transcriptional repressor